MHKNNKIPSEQKKKEPFSFMYLFVMYTPGMKVYCYQIFPQRVICVCKVFWIFLGCGNMFF